ncbi:hypothetical protein AAC387_Pa04g0390 [Persea americana]
MMMPNITLLFFHHLRQSSSSFLFTISKPHFFLLFFFFFISSSSSYSASLRHACDPKTLPNATFLRSDQLTVLISGFSTSRLPLLRSLASSYASSPSVAAVLILWFNPHTPSQTLSKALDLPSSSSASPISLIRHPSSSLNARFLPRRQIRTRAVAVCDDDIDLPPPSLEFAFKIWRSDPARLVGFFARSHDLDLDRRSWIYTVHPDRFSMVLTKFMILGTRYLHRYSCSPEYREMRAAVDRMRNCEDILMNFVVAHEAGVGPTLVGTRRKVRDWGDLRNDDDDKKNSSSSGGGGGGESEKVGSVGISKRVGHMERRGECIREFHRGLGRMPLRYSYGKVVEELGEQGLCEKGGKLVLCDE